MEQENTLNNELKQQVLYSLGAPVIDIELNDDQMKSLYEIAIESYKLFSSFSQNGFDEEEIKEPWINAYFRALCMETLANMRGKFTNLPIPNTEIKLNCDDLYNAAWIEKDFLKGLFTRSIN